MRKVENGRLRPLMLILLLAIGSEAALAAPESRKGSKDVLTEAASDPSFQAKHPLKDAPDAAPRGEAIVLKGENGVESEAYVMFPEGKPRGGVIVFHEWWGLNDFVKLEADKLAALGFVALAVDLYGGEAATDPEKAKQLMQGVDEKTARAIVDNAFGFLESRDPKLDRLATLGWCFGGTWSLRAAIQGGKKVQAAVVYYGELVSDPKILEPLQAPVLAHVPKKDAWITPEMGAKFEKAMKELGKSAQVELYDADHAFANPSNPKHVAGEAERAWEATVKFLEARIPRP